MANSPNRTESVFAEAVALPTGERAAYLNQACAGDAALRGQVDALLRAHERASHLLDKPVPGGPDQTRAYVPKIEPGAIIAGRYKLLEQIGEGGMGAVWVAEQTQPVRRKVALKLIKAGMDSKSVIARFEAERQALAVMDHPNVAKVLDGGLTDTGRPFFAMEYVKGVPITEYCDAARLSVTERLQLFAQVCQAVQHAHQKGIIHRDLKPSNILVAPYDDRPAPKIIDFGLAKAMHQSLTDKTLHTAHESVLGTPLYMSPEQAQLNNLDVDTRSDIYSLGVLLYELLTGTTPLEKQRFKEAAWDEIRRIIREEEPPKPSARLSSTETLPSLAAYRHTEPLKLTSQIRGELDWIVMKALEKDRTRRYETANGLAADVQRFLAGEPVTAYPPSTAYRLRKFVRRNRPQVIAACLVLSALVAGIVGTTFGLLEAKRQERLARVEATAKEQARAAEAEQRQKAETAKVEAQAKEAEANAVVTFFKEQVFAAARPKGQEGGLGANVTLRDAIAAGEPVLDKSFNAQPLVEARLRMTLGITYSYLAEYEQSRKQFDRARDLYARHLGPEHPLTLSSIHNLANSYDDLNRPDEALKLREEVLETRKRVLPKDHPDTLKAMLSLAGSYADLNRQAEALELRENAVEIQKRLLPKDHVDTLGSMYALALSYRALNRRAEALQLFEEVLKIQKRALPEGHLEMVKAMLGVADGYSALNRPAEALKLQEEVLEIQKRMLPKDHPDTLRGMDNLAFTYAALNRQTEALKLREEAVEIMKRVMPKDHPDTLMSLNNLSLSYMDLNRYAEALKLQEEVLEIQKRTLPKDHPDTLMSMNNLANSYTMLDRPAEALKLQEEVLTSRKRVLPKDHPATLGSMVNLANSYSATGRVLDAVKILEQALPVMKQKMPEHQFTFNCMGNLANLYADLDRQDEALKLREELLETEKRVLPKDHPETLEAMLNLANTYVAMNRRPEALKLQEQALEIEKRVLPKDDRVTLATMNNLANSYAAMNRMAEALQLREEVHEIQRRVLPEDDPATLLSMVSLAASLVHAGRAAEGISLIDEFLPKANRPHVDPTLMSTAIELRMVHFRKAGNPAECRVTTEMWEKLNFTDADGLYNTACFRAITSAVQAKTPGDAAAQVAKEDASKAVQWLQKAVESGYKNAAHMKKDPDLDCLREREDFKTLLSELEKAQEK